MSTFAAVAQFKNLRQQPLWSLLAADQGPVICGILKGCFLGADRRLPARALHDQVERALEELRSNGEEMSSTAQVYVATWLRQKWLSREFLAGQTEEHYELTADAIEAIRFVDSLAHPTVSVTESRLAIVMQQVRQLSEDTDPDPTSRINTLKVERDRIDRQLALLGQGIVTVLPRERALERAREILGLAEGLPGDFRRVRDDFDVLNRELREAILDGGGNRGALLEDLFAGVDVISQSEAGRTFSAFWRLLNDPAASSVFLDGVERVLARPFAEGLVPEERRRLGGIMRTLFEEGKEVHAIFQKFARSLRSFVQSGQYLEQRRMNEILKATQKRALEAKEHVVPSRTVMPTLVLAGSNLSSIAQWGLDDPRQRIVDFEMRPGEASEVSLDEVMRQVMRAEIDMAGLSRNVERALRQRPVVTVRDVLELFPATQGLGSVVGLVNLGSDRGYVVEGQTEVVGWVGEDGVSRRARIPTIHFTRRGGS